MIEHNWRQILVGAGLVWPAIRCAISIVPPELMYSVTPVIAKHKSEHVSDQSKQPL
jgi:hypothetical protein